MSEEEYNFYPLDVPISQSKTEPSFNIPATPPSPSNIVPAPNGVIMASGVMQSLNFSHLNSGWIIKANGDVEFGSGTFRGDITGASGTFSGTITATAGAIGGFNIGADYMRDVANSFGLVSTVTGGNDVRLWAGETFANRDTAPFRVYEDGSVVATGLSITQIDIGGADTTSFHVDTSGNMWLGAATYNIATNPFAVSSAGVLRAVSGTIGGNVLSTTSIGSTTFVSGPLGSGWNISNTGSAEFQNATIRGTIRTSVFEKDTISAVNGMVLVTSADILSADMTALDASTLTISGETTFSANEVIRMKDGTNDEWMLVTSAASAPTYTVTRDLAGSYSANNNPIWKKGTAVVSMGVGTGTKTGFTLIDSSSANSPYIDIASRNSNTYSDYTTKVRIGNLAGITDASVGLPTGGQNYGIYTNNGYFTGTFNLGGTQVTIDNTGNIQTSLNTIATAGGGILFLKAGTYTLTSNVSIPAGVTLQGVSRDTTIIDCNTSYKVQIVGSNAYTAGTVTIANGGTTVTGSGTTWTAGMIGRFIYLGKYGDFSWYEITARASNTSITIGAPYSGSTDLAGDTYTIANIVKSAHLAKLTVQNATGSGVKYQYAMECNIDDIYVVGCGTGLDFDQVLFPKVLISADSNGVNLDWNEVSGFEITFSIFSNSTTGAGMVMTSCGNATMFDSGSVGNFGDGINLTSCSLITFISIDVSSNGGQGIELVSNCNDNSFIAANASNNTSDGYKLTATSDRNTITSSAITDNGGYGINIAASTCDNNQIISPAFSNNTSGNINDSGTNTVLIAANTILSAKVSLSSAQIKALWGTPVTLIPAPGAGKTIIVSSVTLSYTYGTAAYTAGQQVGIWYGTDNTNGQTVTFQASLFTTASSAVQTKYASSGTQVNTLGANSSVTIHSTGGITEFGTGDGTAKVIINYSIVTI